MTNNNREDTIMTSAYDRGHDAGFAAAVDREHNGDATSADEGATWFATAPGVSDPAEFERGWLAGWAEFFEGRA